MSWLWAGTRVLPAGLSEKHSDNADATLASGLEARSYQPELNSQRDSATLVSLERRGIDYLNKSLQQPDILKEWVEATEKSLVAVIKAGLDGKEYSKVESLLKDAGEKLAADASYNLQQVTAALLTFKERFETGKDLNRHLSVGVESLVEFSLKQEELHAEIMEKLETAPSQ
ncbi:hypothetical protein BASA62_008128 [Batrachochytrium salamandrivorans]|nr:hypothetical protein BASA62_008128 [Batrachochytrium salamandrivorans]